MAFLSRAFHRSTKYKDIVIAGTTLKVRGLSEAESIAIDAAFERPVPPKKKDPTKGTLADPEPDPDDPAYLTAIRRAARDAIAAETAVAIELELEEKGTLPAAENARGEWLKAAALWMQKTFTEAELGNIWEASRAMGGFEAIKEQARRLIIEYKPEKEGEKKTPRDPYELPKDWIRSEEGLLMRIAARFGQDPIEWPKTLSAEARAKVLGEYELFEREKAFETNVLSSLLARLGG